MQVVPETLVSGSVVSILPPSLPPSTLPPSTLPFPLIHVACLRFPSHLFHRTLSTLPPSTLPPSTPHSCTYLARIYFTDPQWVRVFLGASGTLGDCKMTGGTWRAGWNAPALAGQGTRASRILPVEHDLGGDPRTPHASLVSVFLLPPYIEDLRVCIC